MSDRITYEQAAQLLGCSRQWIQKLVLRGWIVPVKGRQPALPVESVLEAGERWRQEQRDRARAHQERLRPKAPQPPDEEHEWLTIHQAARFLGVTDQAVYKRARRGRLPFVEHAGRRWVRSDHLDIFKRADFVKKGKSSHG